MGVRTTRRRVVQGVALTVGAGLAGCLGSTGGGDGDGGGLTGEDYPTVEEWLTTEEVGGADDSYDGTIVDERGRGTVEIDVGAEGNGGGFAFAPVAVAVSPGTTVRWVWTGEGGAHNVEAEAEEQIGETDFEFESGEAVAGAGTEYTYTFEEPGVALYHCGPHLSLGMKGAVVVTE